MKRDDPCDCKLSKNLKEGDWSLGAVGDSVIVCNKGAIRTLANGTSKRYSSWVELLKEQSLYNDFERIIYCTTGAMVPRENGFAGYSLTYSKKQLVINWHIRIDSFEVSNKRWSDKIRPVLQQRIYARQGNLFISEKRVIFHPHKISELAIKDVNQMYLTQKKQNNKYGMPPLSKRLFVLAMSGHQVSITRLLNLNKEFDVSEDSRLPGYQAIMRQKLKQK
ncbi:hypothetical protein [Pedobacter frigiditerrae]|uniref:hypothetical protein n=1 Tax=Pedobacter frigiditerrae TaxID=2530452 RepID=UPI00104026C0|nr:hypothetical protein [Pedobacter frigiditerrae]